MGRALAHAHAVESHARREYGQGAAASALSGVCLEGRMLQVRRRRKRGVEKSAVARSSVALGDHVCGLHAGRVHDGQGAAVACGRVVEERATVGKEEARAVSRGVGCTASAVSGRVVDECGRRHFEEGVFVVRGHAEGAARGGRVGVEQGVGDGDALVGAVEGEGG